MAAGVLLIIVTVLTMGITVDTSVEDPLGLILSHCPGAGSCDNSALMVCCFQCSCSSDCEVAGDCCVNSSSAISPRRQYTTTNHEACSKTYISHSSLPVTAPDASKSFLLVDFCPSDYEGSARYSCLYPNETNAIQRLPVYSEVTMLNYKNQYCALCNGRTEQLVPWSVSTNCAQLMNSAFYQQEIMARELQSQSNCYVQFLPPPLVKARNCFHEDDVVSTCPAGTTGTIYGQQITTLCDTFYSLIAGKDHIYQNIFCMACHQRLDIIKDRFPCQTLTQTPTNALFFLLNNDIFRLLESTSSRNLETLCPAGLTYVEAVNKCLLVTCPLTHVKTGDVCIQIVKSLHTFTLDYRLRIRNLGKQKLQETEEVFSRIFSIRNPLNVVCQTSIGAERSDSLGVYRPALVFLRVLSDVVLREEIEAFQDTVGYLNKVSSTTRFEKDSPDRLSNFTGDEYTPVFTDTNLYHTSCKPPIISVTDLQICYGVILKPVRILTTGAISADNIVLSRGEYVLQVNRDNNETSAYTCLSTYLSRVTGQPVNIANPFSNVKNMQSEASSLGIAPCLMMMLIASYVVS